MQPAQSCQRDEQSSHNYLLHRKHYCGTCKVIGRQYGHKARLMLNYDTVFLSELLSDLIKDDANDWPEALVAINQCLKMPSQSEKVPIALEYAAAVNVLLAEFKVKDHIADTKSWKWKFINSFYSKSFENAIQQFDSWNIDISGLKLLLKKQIELEKNPVPAAFNLKQTLMHFAAPTAKITAQLFQSAARLINQPNSDEELYDLGYAFGLLAYCLDALEDVERDAYQQQFNPLLLYFNKEKTIGEGQRAVVQEFLLELQDEISSHLGRLPLSEERVEYYAGRMMSSLAERMYREPYVPQGFKTSIRERWNKASKVAFKISCDSNPLIRKLQYYTISLAVFMTPQHTEQLSLEPQAYNFNILALGASFGTALLSILGFSYWYNREDNPPIERPKRRRGKCAPRKKKSREHGCRECDSCCRDLERCTAFLLVILFICAIFGGAAMMGIGIAGLFAMSTLFINWTYWVGGFLILGGTLLTLGLLVVDCGKCPADCYSGESPVYDSMNITFYGGLAVLIIALVASAIIGGLLIGPLIVHGIVLLVLSLLFLIATILVLILLVCPEMC